MGETERHRIGAGRRRNLVHETFEREHVGVLRIMDSPFQESQSRILKTIALDINALSYAGAQGCAIGRDARSHSC